MAYNVSLIKYTVSWLWSLCYTFSAWWDVSSQRNVHKQCPVQRSSVPYCEHTSDPTICKTCCYSRRTNNYRRKRPLLVHTDSQNNFDNLCTFRALNSNYFYTSYYMGVQNRWWCDTDSFGTPFMYSSFELKQLSDALLSEHSIETITWIVKATPFHGEQYLLYKWKYVDGLRSAPQMECKQRLDHDRHQHVYH